jgi:hypothetical protein
MKFCGSLSHENSLSDKNERFFCKVSFDIILLLFAGVRNELNSRTNSAISFNVTSYLNRFRLKTLLVFRNK